MVIRRNIGIGAALSAFVFCKLQKGFKSGMLFILKVRRALINRYQPHAFP